MQDARKPTTAHTCSVIIAFTFTFAMNVGATMSKKNKNTKQKPEFVKFILGIE